MADYIYLLETRLSKAQQAALSSVRAVAREHDVTLFLVGGAIRDLISGAPVRDLDVAVQTNALKLKGSLEKTGAEISSEAVPMQQLHLRWPGGVRMEVASTVSTSYPKPGRVVVTPATILEDLRRRDFTANAMALSLNEGSFGLLMDPLNGVADIENRELRLVSNYGFLEDPVRLIRAARLMARLGWHLDEKTQARYENAREENYIAAMQGTERAYELEELFHEEDPLRVMRRLEEDGWLKQLSPVLSASKANAPELSRMRDTQMQLQEQGIIANTAAANFPLLTTKLAAKEIQAIKESFPRKGFVREIDGLEGMAKEFAAQLLSKQGAAPSQAYRLITSATPVVVLWTAFASKSATVQAKFRAFSNEWPQSRQRIPYLLMQELRITPELPQYEELLEKISFALMDGLLETPEAMKAFLEPYSPPAPPPPVTLRRPRAAKGAKKEPRPSKARKRTEETASAAQEDSTNGVAGVEPAVTSPAEMGDSATGVTAGSQRPASAVAPGSSPSERQRLANGKKSPSNSSGKTSRSEREAPATESPGHRRSEQDGTGRPAPHTGTKRSGAVKAGAAKKRPTPPARRSSPTRSSSTKAKVTPARPGTGKRTSSSATKGKKATRVASKESPRAATRKVARPKKVVRPTSKGSQRKSKPAAKQSSKRR